MSVPAASQAFSAHAPEYTALRRRLVPEYDKFYGTAIQALRPLAEGPGVRRVLDLGAGTGLMTAHVADAFPHASFELLDGSDAMLAEARKTLGALVSAVHVQDMAEPLPEGPFDAVVSALAIHHLEDPQKEELYQRVLEVLRPGGIFVNAEQVAGATPELTKLYDVRWAEQCMAVGATRTEIAEALERRKHDRCTSVETQLAWLRTAGFEWADCYYKEWGMAVLCARKGDSDMGTRDWDASTYDRVSGPQQSWAREQLERLELNGDEIVLDAGCGSGKVTALLVDMVPDGKVYAVDVAPSMVEHTRTALGDRVTAFCQDLTELQLPEPVDAIFSNATFHWIPDHPKLFASLASVLKPGGALVAQCGGFGNIDSFRLLADEVAASGEWGTYFTGWKGPWNYARAEVTAERLAAAGFVDVKTWLEPKPTPLEEPADFVRTVCLVRHLDLLPAELHDSFVDAVLAQAGVPLVLDYVRLNMTARRGEA